MTQVARRRINLKALLQARLAPTDRPTDRDDVTAAKFRFWRHATIIMIIDYSSLALHFCFWRAAERFVK